MVQQVISVLGKDTKKYVPTAIFTYFAFFAINRLTNTLGILPGLPETRVFVYLFLYHCLFHLFCSLLGNFFYRTMVFSCPQNRG